MATDRNDVESSNKVVSHATHQWIKRVAEEELVSWSVNKTIINKGDTYYEYTIDIVIYGTDIEHSPVILTEREYFKQVLIGTPGFKYYDKK